MSGRCIFTKAALFSLRSGTIVRLVQFEDLPAVLMWLLAHENGTRQKANTVHVHLKRPALLKATTGWRVCMGKKMTAFSLPASGCRAAAGSPPSSLPCVSAGPTSAASDTTLSLWRSWGRCGRPTDSVTHHPHPMKEASRLLQNWRRSQYRSENYRYL